MSFCWQRRVLLPRFKEISDRNYRLDYRRDTLLPKKGENPDNVKLNLVINGKGTAWIDNIRLSN